MNNVRKVALLSCAVIFFLTSCSLLPNKNSSENDMNTAVAMTVAAKLATQPVIYITATPAEQLLPTVTPIPPVQSTSTPIPTTAPVQPTATATADNCNLASLSADVTIPDGTEIYEGAAFVKTWRVKNVGTCSWNSNYSLITYNGDNLGAPTSTPLTSLAPGAEMDISVNLTAPTTDGNFQQNFKFRSDSGEIFGTGAGGAYPIFVKIKVIHFYAFTLMPTLLHIPIFPLETMVYDFAANYCSATWKNSATTVLPCPGTTSDSTGFVVRNDSPYLEDGKQYTGEGLFTHPQWINNGTIAGFFPAQAIQSGDHFKATLGCAQGGAACDAIVQLNYSSDGGPTTGLSQWNVKYSSTPVDVNIDLSSMAGHNVAFVLAVAANGSSGQDWIQWVSPRIVK